ncbi:MAG: RloB domain-containing protein [Spirochaetales bacterium]|nr:RloB domain-containing protein [Candidatus Physcosoma equi]
MIDFKSYANWNARPSDLQQERDPKRLYLFVCEGSETERGYIEGLKQKREELGIDSLIDIEVYQKGKGESGGFAPEKLISLADKLNSARKIKKAGDRIVVMFDADVLKDDDDKYQQILKKAEKSNYDLAITYPCFELFLALHLPNAYHDHIQPHAAEFLENAKDSNSQRYIGKYVSQLTHCNTKNGTKVKWHFPGKVKNAIMEEAHLNQDIHCALGKLTSNVGSLFDRLLFPENK